MGFGNLLKKAASKGLEVAGDAFVKGKEMAEESMKAKLAAEEKAKEEKLEARKKEMPTLKTSLNAGCQFGECYQVGAMSPVIGTCNKLVNCKYREMTFYSSSDMLHPDAFPLVKKKALAEQIKVWAYRLNDKFEEKYFLKYAEEIALEAVNEFIETYLPNFNGSEERSLIYEFFGQFVTGNGYKAKIMHAIKDYKIDNITDKLKIISVYTEKDNHRHIGDLSIFKDEFFLYEPSLYQRDIEDFEYTLTLLNAVTKKEENLIKFYKDIDVISLDDLYDESKKLKPVGNRGDGYETLLGVVESWSSCGNSKKDMQTFLSSGETEDITDNLIDDRLLVLPELMRAHAIPTTFELKKEDLKYI